MTHNPTGLRAILRAASCFDLLISLLIAISCRFAAITMQLPPKTLKLIVEGICLIGIAEGVWGTRPL